MNPRARILLVVLSLVGAVALTFPHGARSQVQELLPDATIEASLCCSARDVRPGPLSQRAVSGEREAPVGVPVTAEQLRQLHEQARHDPSARRAHEVDVIPAQAEPGPLAPKIRTSFSGLNISSAGGSTPPDTQLAVGPEHVLEAVNVALRLSSKTNKNVQVQSIENHFGFDPSEVFMFDPKLHYDPLSGRFFLLLVEMSSKDKRARVYLSVSRSSTPGGLGAEDWCNYSFNSRVGQSWSDYPGLGMNDKWLAVSTNNFKFAGSFLRSMLWVIDKTTLTDNASKCPPKLKVFKFSLKKDTAGEEVFNAQPAQHYDASSEAGSPLYALSSRFTSFDTDYVLWRIATKGTRGAVKPAVSNTIVTGTGYGFPPSATQKGGTNELDTGDPRIMQQLVFVNGRLWFTQVSGCTFEDDPDTVLSCIEVGRIDPNSGDLEFEDFFGKRGHFLFWPGLAVANNGDVVSVFQMAGDKTRLSTAYNGLKKGAARFGPVRRMADSFDKIKISGKGKCPPDVASGSSGLVRTGDYVAAARDPSSNNGLWVSGQHGQAFGQCWWGTKIVRVGY